MKKFSWKGKLVIASIIIVLIILIIVGIKYLPIWSTIEAIFTMIIGFFFGWMGRAKKESKDETEN